MSYARVCVPMWGIILFTSCARYPDWPTPGHPVTEGGTELGGGFRRVALAEFITGGFESVYHGEYLYYRQRQLGDFISSSISPSREFAAFAEDDLNSQIRYDHLGYHVFIFRVSDQKAIRLTKELRYDWKAFDWDEPAGYLILHYGHAPPEKFSLPRS